MADKDGGPAFPVYELNGQGQIELVRPGMTLRDYFAAKAMQAAATNPDGIYGLTFSERSAWAYTQADAMLKERDK